MKFIQSHNAQESDSWVVSDQPLADICFIRLSLLTSFSGNNATASRLTTYNNIAKVHA